MEISVYRILSGLLLLAIPLFIMYAYHVKGIARTLRSVCRMVIVLGLTGLFLKYIMAWNQAVVNILWVFLMAACTSASTISQARLKQKPYWIPVMSGMLSSLLLVGGIFLLFVLGMKNPFESRFFIPVMGLLLGGMMDTDVQALSVYYMGLRHHGHLFEYMRGNGATRAEALSYLLRRALERTTVPHVAQMSMQVLACSPVMMWGMLLAGMEVAEAVFFHLLVLVAIFAASMLSVVVAISVARQYALDEYEQIR